MFAEWRGGFYAVGQSSALSYKKTNEAERRARIGELVRTGFVGVCFVLYRVDLDGVFRNATEGVPYSDPESQKRLNIRTIRMSASEKIQPMSDDSWVMDERSFC